MPFSRPCESVAGCSDFMRRWLWVQRTHLNLVRSMQRLLAMLVIAGCQALAQTPGETAHGNLSLQVASPAASPTPALPHQKLATPPPDKPHGVSNPKELSEPVKLVAADIIMDGSESVCGKLRGANGKEFWFFLCHGPFAFESNPEEGLYVGYMSGHISWETARARFEGWSEIDFYSLVERTIKDEFTWDRQIHRFAPKDPKAFDNPTQMETFGRTAAKRLLRYAEAKLHRDHSYMD
jgi:hypothetical protein